MGVAPAIVFCAEVLLFPTAKASWHFVRVPFNAAEQIRFFAGDKKRGWGSVRVAVRIGDTQWKTSVFPETKTKTYLLPLKEAVRRSEKIALGDTVQVTLNLVET